MPDLNKVDLEHWEKVAKALEFFGVTALAILAYVAGKWRHLRQARPRARIAILEARADDFAKLLGDLTANVSGNSGNIDELMEQIAAIQADNENKFITHQDIKTIRAELAKLDNRLFDLAGGMGNRQPLFPGKRHDPRD